jgi:hypothetical protein
MLLKMTIKTLYGVKKYYPACETSKLLVQLTGHKTFTSFDIDVLKQLKYEIENVTPKDTI